MNASFGLRDAAFSKLAVDSAHLPCRRSMDPIVDPSQSGKRSGKVRIEPRRLLKKLLGLFNSGAKLVRTRAQIVSLDKHQVGFAVFRGLAFDLRPFRG